MVHGQIVGDSTEPGQELFPVVVAPQGAQGANPGLLEDVLRQVPPLRKNPVEIGEEGQPVPLVKLVEGPVRTIHAQPDEDLVLRRRGGFG